MINTLAAQLSYKELVHDWRASLCFVAALMGVMAPLLVILALKNGVIGTLVGRLVENPGNRELIAIGSGSHAPSFFEALAVREDVAFVVPATRSINGLANAVRNPDLRRMERAVPIIPSAAGDPLLDGPPVTRGGAYATQALLDTLEAETGGTLEMIIGRSIDGVEESARARLEILGTVPREIYSKPALFLSLGDLLAVEAFRDDPAVTSANWLESRPHPETFASFRLYASRLEDLRGLKAELDRLDVAARPRAENAMLLLQFQRNLNRLYAFIALIAVAGFWAAMAANLRGMVERQRIAYSMLCLIGMSGGQRRFIPLVHSLVLVLSGALLTLVLVVPFIAVINRIFTRVPGENIASLGPQHILATLLIAIVTAVSASIWAVRAVASIHTDEVVQHA